MRGRRAFGERLAVALALVAGGLTGFTPAGPPPAGAAPAPGTISTFAGGTGEGPALNVSVQPEQLAARGSLVYIVDSTHEAVRALDTRTGELRTVAGNGDPEVWASSTPRGDGGPATASRIAKATGVAVDATGRVYVGDYEDGRVRRVDGSGVITTFAGGGNPSQGRGDGGPATQAALSPNAVVTDPRGNVFVSERFHVRKVSSTNVISTVAGKTCPCDDSDPSGKPATEASISVSAMAVDAGGQLHVTTAGLVLRLDDAGVLRRVAGGGSPGDGVGDGGRATEARLVEPSALGFDAAGNLFIADAGGHRVRKVDPSGTITTAVGGGSPADGLGDGGPATAASLSRPTGVVAGAEGALYVSDTYHQRLRKVSGGVITTVAGNGKGRSGGDGGPASKAQFSTPAGMARDAAGNTYVAEHDSERVRKIDAAGRVSTFAGTGEFGFSGDGGPATAARLHGPVAVAADGRGNVFITDQWNGRVRRVDAAGIITTVAGGGVEALGDGGPATAVSLREPSGLAVDAAGNLYVADRGNRRVRKVGTDGRITTFAGGATPVGTPAGDGGPATAAAFSLTRGASLAFDALGQLHIADVDAGSVRRVDLAGIVTTVVQVDDAGGIAFDANGDLYVVAGYSDRVVRVDAMGRVRMVAGTGDLRTGLGDGGPALVARVDPDGYSGLAADGAGGLYLADSRNHRVRRIQLATAPRRVTTTGWNGFGQLGDGTTTDRHSVTVAAGLQHVRSVAAGYYHSLAVRADGTVWAWGWNGFGQLGDGTTTDRRVPTRVNGLQDVVAVAGGAYNSLALRADGTVWAWGWNGVGQLGDGTTTDRSLPVRVGSVAGVKAISAGSFHGLALTHDGDVWSWGWNYFGQLGTGSPAEVEPRPVPVPGATGATTISAGALHSLANRLTADGEAVWSWGWNGVGQLGDGTTVDRRTPVRINAFGRAWAGGYHSFAGTPGGWIDAWGWNALGQLGVPTPGPVVASPTPVDLRIWADHLAPGLVHTAAVATDASIATWGWNPYGGLGDGSVTTRPRPAAVPGISGERAAAGAFHTLIVR